MPWLQTIFSEIYSLFIDDGSFAISILVWLGLTWLFLPRLDIFLRWKGLILFAGLGLMLIESTTRYARNKGTRPGK